MRRSRKGFTLLELLIVAGVIVILLAILLPVISKSRENARNAACVSNQHEVYVALRAFAADNTEFCPGCAGSPAAKANAPNIGVGQLTSLNENVSQASLDRFAQSILIVRNYCKSEAIFHCPQQDANIPYAQQTFLSIVGSAGDSGFQYTFNELFVGTLQTTAPKYMPVYDPSRYPKTTALQSTMNLTKQVYAISISRSTNPAACVLITEKGFDWDYTHYYTDTSLPNNPTYVNAWPWHNQRGHKTTDKFSFVNADMAVCTYLDGHTVMVNVEMHDNIGANYYVVPSDQTISGPQ